MNNDRGTESTLSIRRIAPSSLRDVSRVRIFSAAPAQSFFSIETETVLVPFALERFFLKNLELARNCPLAERAPRAGIRFFSEYRRANGISSGDKLLEKENFGEKGMV